MSRTRAVYICPTCKQVPKAGGDGKLACECADKKWIWMLGIEANEEERTILARKGFDRAQDIRGDVYYLGPNNRLLHMFEDGTWQLDDESEHNTLEDYLNSLPDMEARA